MRNRKRLRSTPAGIIVATSAGRTTIPHHGGVKGGSSLPFAKDRIETESSRIWREWKAGRMARLRSLRGRRRHVRCPWPTIKSSLSRKWAARRLKQSIEGRESDDRCRQYSNSISVPVFFGPAPGPASTSAAAAATAAARSFILFYWGAIDDVFQGRNLWRRGEVKRSEEESLWVSCTVLLRSDGIQHSLGYPDFKKGQGENLVLYRPCTWSWSPPKH